MLEPVLKLLVDEPLLQQVNSCYCLQIYYLYLELSQLVELLLDLLFKVFDPRFDVIYATTMGGPNDATTNLHIMAYQYAFQWYQIGKGMAQAVVLLILVVLVSYLLLRLWNRASERNVQ